WINIGNVTSIVPKKYDGFPRVFGYSSIDTSPVGYHARVRTPYNVALVEGREYTLSWIGTTSDFVNRDYNYTAVLRPDGTFQRRLTVSKEKVGTIERKGVTKNIYKYIAHFTHSLQSDENYAIMIGSEVTRESAPWLAFTDVMLEHGTVAGDWDISPEDTDQRMSIAESE